MIENQDFRYGFTPRYREEIPYMQQDAILELSFQLMKLLETGDRFTAKLVKEEPGPGYYLYTYRLEIGKVHQRELYEVQPFDLADIQLPKRTLQATPLKTLLREIVRRALSQWTMAQVDADIRRFNATN